MGWPTAYGLAAGGEVEDFVDESDLTVNVVPSQPSNLPLPHHVHCLISLDGSPRRLKFPESLFSGDPPFDGSMILFQNVVQEVHGPVPTAVTQRSFLLNTRNRRAVDGSLIGVDDARRGMRPISQGLAKQAFGRIGVVQRRQQEIDGGTRGVDGAVPIAPAAFHPKTPPDRTQDEIRLGLPPLDNLRSGRHPRIFSAYRPTPAESCNTSAAVRVYGCALRTTEVIEKYRRNLE
jgi:hypothetical protein